MSRAEPRAGAMVERVDITLCAHCQGRIVRAVGVVAASAWSHMSEGTRRGGRRCDPNDPRTGGDHEQPAQGSMDRLAAGKAQRQRFNLGDHEQPKPDQVAPSLDPGVTWPDGARVRFTNKAIEAMKRPRWDRPLKTPKGGYLGVFTVVNTDDSLHDVILAETGERWGSAWLEFVAPADHEQPKPERTRAGTVVMPKHPYPGDATAALDEQPKPEGRVMAVDMKPPPRYGASARGGGAFRGAG